MGQVQDQAGAAREVRRGPTPYSQAVQEAKRLEKMQTMSSSHRAGGPLQPAPAAAKDRAP